MFEGGYINEFAILESCNTASVRLRDKSTEVFLGWYKNTKNGLVMAMEVATCRRKERRVTACVLSIYSSRNDMFSHVNTIF